MVDGDSVTIQTQIFNQGFSLYLHGGDFSDLTLECGDHKYSVHQLILSYSSKYFQKQIKALRKKKRRRSDKEKNFKLVLLLDPTVVSPQDLKLVLQFAYDGYIDFTQDNVLPLLKMANFFQMKELKKLAGEYIARHITRENAVSMLKRAVDYDTEEVQTKCLATISKHFSHLVECGETFVHLPVNLMIRLLSTDNLIVSSEYLVLRTVCKYVEENARLTNSQKEFLFETVRFPLMTVEQLEEATTNSMVPKYLLTEALLFRLRKHEHVENDKMDKSPEKSSNSSSSQKLSSLITDPPAPPAPFPEGSASAQMRAVSRQTCRAAYAISLEYQSDFDENGLFYYISTNGKKEPWVNCAARGRIRISNSSTEKGDLYNVLERDPHEFWTMDVPSSWICINLGSKRILVPNYYTLRHGGNSKADALRNWLFQGSNDWNEWEVIKRHTDDCSLSSNFSTASWPIFNCTTPYRYFRVLQTGHNSSNHNFLSISGIELYGDLYEARS